MRSLSSLMPVALPVKSKARNRDDDLGEQMEKFFGMKLYWVPKRYGWQETYEAFKECEHRGKTSKQYLLAILNRRKREAALKAIEQVPAK